MLHWRKSVRIDDDIKWNDINGSKIRIACRGEKRARRDSVPLWCRHWRRGMEVRFRGERKQAKDSVDSGASHHSAQRNNGMTF